MSKYRIKLLSALIMCMVSMTMYAQSACDKLFASGVKLQQTMTVSSQRKAINSFEKAKVCYDSQTKKDLCDQQIKACRNIIAQITKNAEQAASDKAKKELEEKEKEESTKELPATPEVKRDITLTIGNTYIKFKGKGGEFKKVQVTCNYPDWEVTEALDWVNYSRNENNEIVIEAEKNPLKEERSGTLKIECGDKSVTLTIIQEKFKRFVVI